MNRAIIQAATMGNRVSQPPSSGAAVVKKVIARGDCRLHNMMVLLPLYISVAVETTRTYNRAFTLNGLRKYKNRLAK